MNRKVEVFTAGCPICHEAVDLVRTVACPDCEVTVYDLRVGCETNACRDRARDYGVTSVPTVVVDARIVDCCVRAPVSEQALRAAGIGHRL